MFVCVCHPGGDGGDGAASLLAAHEGEVALVEAAGNIYVYNVLVYIYIYS